MWIIQTGLDENNQFGAGRELNFSQSKLSSVGVMWGEKAKLLETSKMQRQASLRFGLLGLKLRELLGDLGKSIENTIYTSQTCVIDNTLDTCFCE